MVSHPYLRLAFALLFAAAVCSCTVPELKDLPPKACDQAHPCVEGYVCAAGVCVVAGGDCTVGETRACGSDEGACVAGTQTCPNGTWSACEGEVGPSMAATFYKDADGDGHGDPTATLNDCVAPAGYVESQDDCDDGHATALPGGMELCDGLDNDCNGSADDGIPDAQKSTFYEDKDGDGFGNGAVTTRACAQPTGFVTLGNDCDDALSTVNPNASETCNGVDDNCDGTVDEGVKGTFFADADGDGFGAVAPTAEACSAPMGFVSNSSDCLDTNPAVHPGATEVCDGVDNDCNGTTDDPAEIPLVVTANTATSSLSWVKAGTGLSAVYVDTVSGAPHVFFRRFGPDLIPVGGAVDISQPGAVQSTHPAVAALPFAGDVVAVWVDQISGGAQRLVMARLNAQGGLVWTDSGGVPTRLFVSAPVSIIKAPRVAVSGGVILVSWIDAAAQQVRAATFMQTGQAVKPPTLLSDLGAPPLDLDVEANPKNNAEFVIGTNGLTNGIFEVRFGLFNQLLLAQGTKNFFTAAGEVSELDLVIDTSSQDELSAAWVEQDSAMNYRILHTPAPVTGFPPFQLVGPTPDLLSNLSGHSSGAMGGLAWAYTEGLANPVVKVAGTALASVTPANVSSYAPALTGLGGAFPFVVGYEQDKGQSLDLYGKVLCSP